MLLSLTQIESTESDNAATALRQSEAKKAQAAFTAAHVSAAKLAVERAAAAALLLAPPVVGPQSLASSLPATFLAMGDTKLQSTQAIDLYRSQQIALAAARDDVVKFTARCTKNAPSIQLPQMHRPTFSGAARFTAIEGPGNAAFYKTETDALRKLEDDSSQQAFDLIVRGRKKFIAHLESLVKTQSFVARALTGHTEFVKHVNRLHAERGSSTVVPLEAACAHFEQKLRREMEAYDSEQIQAALAANRNAKESIDVEMKAEEDIVKGAHGGQNIAAIALKAVMPRQTQAEKTLDAAVLRIAQLEKAAAAAAASPAHSSSKPETGKSKAQKRKKPDQSRKTSAAAAGSHGDAMSDVAVPPPVQQSNSHGGGRQRQHSNHKKAKVGGREGDKSVASGPGAPAPSATVTPKMRK